MRFTVDGKQKAVVGRAAAGLWGTTLGTAALPHGRHTLTAVAVDTSGRSVSERRIVSVCRK